MNPLIYVCINLKDDSLIIFPSHNSEIMTSKQEVYFQTSLKPISVIRFDSPAPKIIGFFLSNLDNSIKSMKAWSSISPQNNHYTFLHIMESHYKSVSVYSQISSTNTCERVRSIPSFSFLTIWVASPWVKMCDSLWVYLMMFAVILWNFASVLPILMHYHE